MEPICKFFIICMGVADTWKQIVSVETVFAYNLGGASNSKEVNL